MNVIVRMPNWLGDLVMALPALAGVGEALPGARRIAMAPASLAPLLEGAAEEVVALSSGREGRDAVRRVARGADLGLLLTTSFSSAFLLRRAGVRHLVGYPTEGRFVLGVRGPRRPHAHLSEQYARLVDRVGTWSRDLTPRLPSASRLREEMAPRLAEFGLTERPRVAVFPGAAYGPAKRWPRERFAGVTRALAETGACVAVCGTVAERTEAVAVAESSGLGRQAVAAGRTSLREMAGLLTHVDLVLANDSGALHLASACGAPTVGIFGSTDPAWTAPAQGVVLRRPTPCAPCFRRTCDIGLRCLLNVSAGEVLEACRRILADGGSHEAA